MTAPDPTSTPGSKSPALPTDNDLANYARAYIGAYLSAVRQENPEHVPKFAQEHPYSVEVSLMPNGCFVMLFEKAETSSIAVSQQNWEYVNSKVMSGISYLVTVYPHEGFHLKDASYRGKRDALRDIRVFENSDLVDATKQLERLLTELSDVSKWNKNPLNMAEMAMTKLGAIKQEVQRAGPSMDFMSMVEGMKNFKSGVDVAQIDPKVLELLSTVQQDFQDLAQVVANAKNQDARIEEIEKSLKSELEDFKVTLDKKMAKGLAVVLTTADRKIDKAIGSLTEELSNVKLPSGQPLVAQPEEIEIDLSPIESRIDELAASIETVRQESQAREIPQVDLTPFESRMDQLAQQIEALRLAKPAKEKPIDLDPLQSRIEKLEGELALVRDAASAQQEPVDLAPIEDRLTKMTVDVETLKRQSGQKPEPVNFAPLEAKIAKLAGELDSVRRQASQKEAPVDLAPLETRVGKMALDFDALRRTALQKEEPVNLAPLESKVNRLVGEVEVVRRQVMEREEPEVDLAPLEVQISKLTEDYEELKNQMSQKPEFEVDFSPIESRFSELSEEMGALREQLDKVQALVLEAETKMAEGRVKAEGATPEVVDQLRGEVMKLGNRVRRMEDYLVALSQTRRTVQQQY